MAKFDHCTTVIISLLNGPSSQRVDLTKIHRKAQPPHEVSTTFNCSHQMILPSLSIISNAKKIVKLPLHKQLLSGLPVKNPS